ncbi:MAG: TIGR02186 family protein [Firmicutes bacterium]|nr:TIGR02186 family protein [Bacillota bacterium]
MRVLLRLWSVVLAVVLLPGAAAVASFTVTPQTVEVGAGFDGTVVKVSGKVPEGAAVYIKAVAPERPAGLSKQGRKGGLWMAVETVTVRGMPGMYQVLASGAVRDLPPELMALTGIDPEYAALRANARVTEKHEDRTVELPPERAAEFTAGLVRLYERRGLYAVRDRAVRVEGETFEADLVIPADIPKGETHITVYAVKDGAVVGNSVQPLVVESVGLVRLMATMAQTNPVAYGLLAVGVALVAGLSISWAFRQINRLVFKEEGIGAHH